ncbi:uncharacterized protein associated with RNAses G and E [Spiroplasma sabaudiense Ar-1343]|uniref:Uncharacterized protein associated with RNAses G and E n=1 Tax=Spiroplasma sabaudiense Ar-1343 TaxID=1276257 RepID=W6AIL5_9MOLU|nr:DUF402 domain-containing protein [Spiroplasma sabaudiense]AHI53549.1 uncharacterized protein associated with RNAses G and E [Spiroplasma sabaudiense Ar-1343]
MENLKKGDFVLVHAYKHNGSVYRSWERSIVFENNSDNLILINEEVVVTELNGRKWKTNEPAIWFFSKKDWYNVICMFKEWGINYYCNMASPYIIEDKTIKYVDYDLDIKVFNDNSFRILDLKDFNRNRINFSYSQEIINRIWSEIETLKEKIRQKEGCFNHDLVKSHWKEFVEQIKPKIVKLETETETEIGE